MSKSRLASGRVKKIAGTNLSPTRYEYLDLANTEPDLGLPTVDESVLIGDIDGTRAWVDIATYADEFKGFTGSQGEVGFTGSQGAPGTGGSEGTPGFTGSQGDQGDTGFVGSQGLVGFTGSQGDQGSQGVVGFVGSQGDQGLVGFTGSQGDQGFTGSQGDVGFAGSQGDLGFTGSIGFTGSKGAQIFRDLSDTPSSFANQKGKLVAVNDAETALEFVGNFPLRFLDLIDTPASYFGNGAKVVAVKANAEGLEFIDIAGDGGGDGGGATQFVKTYFYEGILSANTGNVNLIIHRTSTLTAVRIYIGEVGTSDITLLIKRNGTSILTITVPGSTQLVNETDLTTVLNENDRITVDILQGSITSRDLYVTVVYEV